MATPPAQKAAVWALLGSPPLAVLTWEFAWSYADTHGAEHGETMFDWWPVLAFSCFAVAWMTCAVLALAAGHSRDRRLAVTGGLVVVSLQVCMTHGICLVTAGEDAFPPGSDVLGVLALGAVLSLSPLAAVVWSLRRSPLTPSDPELPHRRHQFKLPSAP